MTNNQKNAVVAVIGAVYETVIAAGPQGAPAGVLYAAMMGHGCTLSQYQQIESILVRSGRVRKEGDVLYAA